MGKIKERKPKGLERRRQEISIDSIEDAQKGNRAKLLGMVRPGDIERYYDKLATEAIDNGKPWAMRLFAEQILGPVKTESVQKVFDVAALLNIYSEQQKENEVVIDVDAVG